MSCVTIFLLTFTFIAMRENFQSIFFSSFEANRKKILHEKTYEFVCTKAKFFILCLIPAAYVDENEVFVSRKKWIMVDKLSYMIRWIFDFSLFWARKRNEKENLIYLWLTKINYACIQNFSYAQLYSCPLFWEDITNAKKIFGYFTFYCIKIFKLYNYRYFRCKAFSRNKNCYGGQVNVT